MMSKAFKRISLLSVVIILFVCNAIGVIAYDDRVVSDYHYNEGKIYYDSGYQAMEVRNDMYHYNYFAMGGIAYELVLTDCGDYNPTISYSLLEAYGITSPYKPWVRYSRYGIKKSETEQQVMAYWDYTINQYGGYTYYDIWAADYICDDDVIDVIY